MLIRYFFLLVAAFASGREAAAQNPCDQVPEALKIAAEIRELPIKREIGCRLLNKAQFKDLLTKLILNDLDKTQLLHEQQIFRLIGLIPPDYPYAQCLVDVYASESAAFYYSQGGYMVIPDWMPVSLSVLVHEAAHALQDQHFDLSQLDASKTLFSDRYLAVSALIEGDALWVENEMRGRFPDRAGEPPAFEHKIEITDPACKTPETLEQLFQFEYDFGLQFVDRLKNSGGWEAVNRAFHKPPRTTRFILHPGDTDHSNRSDLGEMIVRTLLLKWAGPKQAVRGAGGLKGDKMEKTPRGLTWRLEWDTAEDAAEFIQVFALRFKLQVAPNARWARFASEDIEGEMKAEGATVLIELAQAF